MRISVHGFDVLFRLCKDGTLFEKLYPTLFRPQQKAQKLWVVTVAEQIEGGRRMLPTTYTLLEVDEATDSWRKIKGGTRDEVFNAAHAIWAASKMERGTKYLLVCHPDGKETRYNGEIGTVHAT